MNKTLRVIDIVAGTTVDGPGFRTSIYFAGCEHHCEGCHNPQTWDSQSGNDMTVDEIIKVIEDNDFDVTFTGGDPMIQADRLLPLAKRIVEKGKTIWCYTGYLYEALINKKCVTELLNYVEVIVDGPFVKDKADIALLFRGSSNQRLIDVKKTTEKGMICLWKSDF